MDSISMEELQFSVIVNKVEEEDYEFLVPGEGEITNGNFDKDALLSVNASINAGKHTTLNFFFLKKLKELNRKKNAVITLSSAFRCFIHNAPRIEIKSASDVKTISTNAEEIRVLREELEERSNNMQASLEAATARLQQVVEQQEDSIQSLQAQSLKQEKSSMKMITERDAMIKSLNERNSSHQGAVERVMAQQEGLIRSLHSSNSRNDTDTIFNMIPGVAQARGHVKILG